MAGSAQVYQLNQYRFYVGMIIKGKNFQASGHPLVLYGQLSTSEVKSLFGCVINF